MTKSNIQKNFEDLYKNIDPQSRKQDDKRCLQDEATSIRNKELAKDPDWLKATTRANKLKAKDPNWLKATTKAQQKKWKDKEFAEKMIDTLVQASKDPNRRKKISKARKEYWKDPINKINASIKSSNNWKDADYIEKVMASQRIAISTPFGNFISQSEFYKQTKLNFKDKNKEMPHLYYVTNKGPGKPTYEAVYFSPEGEFKNKKQAFISAQNKNNLKVKSQKTGEFTIEKYQTWWNKVSKQYPRDYYTKTMIRREWIA